MSHSKCATNIVYKRKMCTVLSAIFMILFWVTVISIKIDCCHATAEAETCWSLIKMDFLTWRMSFGLNMLSVCFSFFFFFFLTKSHTSLHVALISLFFFSLVCITSSVGGELGCGRGSILPAITTTTTRSGKCVLDCIFVEVGMFALAHTNISG